MSVMIKNNAKGRLSVSLAPGGTTLSLMAGEGAAFPEPAAGDWFPVTLIKDDGTLEVCHCTARAGDTLTVTRAQEGTLAAAFNVGDRAELRLTAGVFDSMQTKLDDGLATMDTQLTEGLASIDAKIDTKITSDITPRIGTEGALSFRNKVINGGFDIWQRGTSFTPDAVRFGADRFACYKSGAVAGDYAQSTDVPEGLGFTYSARLNGGDLRHTIELPAAGKPGVFTPGSKWTLSFYVKGDIESGTPVVDLRWASGVSAGSSVFWGSEQPFTCNTTWQRISRTFTVPSAPTTNHLAVFLHFANWGTNVNITGIQLEAGEVVTPFEHRPIGLELSLCQRYFQVLELFEQGGYLSSYPHNMRVTPSITRTGVHPGTSADGPTIVSPLPKSIILGNNNSSAGWGGTFTLAAEL